MADHTFFDGQINRLFTDGDSIEGDDVLKRLYAMELMKLYVPSQYNDAKFDEVTQGRAKAAYETRSFFSTCGELVMFLLYRLGYIGNILNRALNEDIPEATGGGKVKRQYKYGKNMEYIFSHSKTEGVWVEFDGTNRPQPGDCVFIANFSAGSHSEHVFVFERLVAEEGHEHWHSFDAGQVLDHNYEQCCKRCERELLGHKLGGRTVHGWIDITKLKLDCTANLNVPVA